MHVDNKGAVDDSYNKSGRRTRHINIKFHAVREAVRHGEIMVVKVRGGVGGMVQNCLAIPLCIFCNSVYLSQEIGIL